MSPRPGPSRASAAPPPGSAARRRRRCRRSRCRSRPARRWRGGPGSETCCRRWRERRPDRGRRAGGRAPPAGNRGPSRDGPASNREGPSSVTAKNSPMGRAKRSFSSFSVREASVSLALPPRMLRRPGVAGARTAATAPITAQTTRTAQRQRTSARAKRSIRFSGSSGTSAPHRTARAANVRSVQDSAPAARDARWRHGASLANIPTNHATCLPPPRHSGPRGADPGRPDRAPDARLGPRGRGRPGSQRHPVGYGAS